MNRWNFFLLGVLGSCTIRSVVGKEPFKAAPKSISFMTYFASRYRGICSGVLVGPKVVLTAAVCVINPVSLVHDVRPVTVVVGSMYRHMRRGIRVPITKIIIPRIRKGHLSAPEQAAMMQKGTRVVLAPEYRPKNMETLVEGTVVRDSHDNSGFVTVSWDDGRTVEYPMGFEGKYYLELPVDLTERGHILSRSPAVMLMKRFVPDVLTEVPVRPLPLSFILDPPLKLQQECLLAGWHFFYRNDKIYPVHKFLLQRNLRVQFVSIVKMQEWCDALHMKLAAALASLGDVVSLEGDAMVCVKDGMYGAPFVCEGKAVGMLMAPDGQWENCTGFSNIVHLFQASYLRNFFECIKELFSAETSTWTMMKKALYDENLDSYDYIPALYDPILEVESSSSEVR